ncbi:MAG: CoA pyrophosphatase, partial [Bacteroidota bacterium]
EEVGVSHQDVNTIGNLTDLYVVASNYLVLPVVGVLDTPPGFVKDPHEVDEIIEVKLSDLMDERNNKSMDMKIMQGITIHSPYFDLNQKVVWGATAMILSELKLILQPYFSDKGIM